METNTETNTASLEDRIAAQFGAGDDDPPSEQAPIERAPSRASDDADLPEPEARDESLEDRIARQFGVSDDEPAPEPRAREPETSQKPPQSQSSDEALWTAAEVQHLHQIHDTEKLLKAEAEKFLQSLPYLEQQAARDPNLARDIRARVQMQQDDLVKAFEQLKVAKENLSLGPLSRRVAHERERLKAAVPIDPAALRSYLLNHGFTENEIASCHDHRPLVLAEKARLWDEHQRQLKTAPREVKTVKKITAQRKGPPKSKAQQIEEKIAASFDKPKVLAFSSRAEAEAKARALSKAKGKTFTVKTVKRIG